MAVGVVIVLAVVVAIVAAIALAVFVVSRLRSGESVDLSLRTILAGYFTLMTVAAVVMLALGMTTLVKAGLSQAFGRDFSYYVPTRASFPAPVQPAAPGAEQPPDVEQQLQSGQRRIEQQYRSDLVQGGTLALVGAILWPLHAWGRRRVADPASPVTRFLARAQQIVLLVLFSLVGLFSLPTALYELLRRFLIPADDSGIASPPGEAVATALVFVPLWVFFLWSTLRRVNAESPAGVSES
jgi:hypothetical protein